MAANDKFCLPAYSSDASSYTNGHRSLYSVSSFERSGCFREASGNGMTSSFGSMSKSACAPSHGEGTNILSSLISNLKPVVLDQKFTRPGEMNRAVSSIIGISSGQSAKTIPPRTFPSASAEEIRSLKHNLQENSIKARDRVKAFNEASSKVEKHCRSISKKRSIAVSTPNDWSMPTNIQGGNIPKVIPHGLQITSEVDSVPHKLDDRTKKSLPNRKLRTSVTDMDARPIGISKSSGSLDKVRDALEFGQALSEERNEEPLLAIEGWDNLRTKKKRSAIKSDVSAGTILATHTPQQKVLGEAKPIINSNSLRHKSQQDACSVSFTLNPKMNAPSRGPRSSLVTLPKPAGSPQQTMSGNDDRDPRNFVKQNSVNGAINRKRSTSARSPSPPVAYWNGQKIRRVARRSNVGPVVSDHNNAPALDTLDNPISNEEKSGVTKCSSSEASPQVKLKADDVLSGGLSECKESPLANYKLKNKSKNHDAQCIGEAVQKVGTSLLPSKNSKLTVDDANAGILRKRTGEGIISFRPNIAASDEKACDIGTPSQLRKSKVGSERSESNFARPPLKDTDRKGHARPQHSLNTTVLDFPDQAIDDTEALFSAANAVVDAGRFCSSMFWKQIQPFFSFLSSGHIAFLNEQICPMDGSIPNNHAVRDYGQKIMEELEYISLPSTGANGINKCAKDNGLTWQMDHVDPILEQFVQGIGSQGGVSICQALLSAIIEEEDFENLDYSNLTDDPVLHDYQGGGFCDSKQKTKPSGLSSQTSSTLRVDEGCFSSCFMASSGLHCTNHILHQKLGSNGINVDAENLYTEFEYNQMCVNDRIVLELRHLGLYSDPMPELTPNEHEDISASISCLQEKLHERVLEKKRILSNLEKVVLEERETEQRELERFALDTLVWMTYEKFMQAYLNPNSSSSKSASKHNQHVELSCVKQTLARCHNFEDKGVNCFSESAFKEIFQSISFDLSDAECPDMTFDDGISRNRTNNLLEKKLQIKGNGAARVPKQSRVLGNQVKSSGTPQVVSHPLEQTFDKDDSNKGRKRELLLDDVVDSSPPGSLQISKITLPSGTKGKRSNREGKPSKDVISRNGTASTAKVGRPPTSNLKGARRNRTKVKQRTSNLSASIKGEGGEGGPKAEFTSGGPKAEFTSGGPKAELTSVPKSSGVEDSRTRNNDAAELPSHFPDIDVCGFDGNGQDIDSWFNIDDDGMQDHDFMDGLHIPMDNLEEIF